MDLLSPSRLRELYSLFSFGHGVRSAARASGIARDTCMRYRRQWLELRPTLQQAYDEMWEGNCERCDEITAPLPEPAVIAMLDAWSNDYEENNNPKSGFH